MNTQSEWIWLRKGQSPDQYADFYDCFDAENAPVMLSISADSNYAVYINDRLAAFGQYPDFPHDKVYDEVDVTAFCRPGKNHLAIQVWYYGESSMGYYPGNAALRYEVWNHEKLCCRSGIHTLSRQSKEYICGLQKKITHQLGFSFKADLTGRDSWRMGELYGFESSTIMGQNLPLRKRPCKQLRLGTPAPSQLVRKENATCFLYDLGCEEVGFLNVRIQSSCEQDVMITYGEHIVDGCVRRLIGGRDFSVELRLKKGLNEYVNPFRRLGLRYLELFAKEQVQVECLTVIPVYYPVQRCPKPLMDELQTKIYDVSVRTLELCMHEHYEDTPWREQALYAMDSRNQMLCGYDAFQEYVFPRANLLLMSKDEREDGLLSICTPSSDNLTIPSFSLHYFTAVWEYTQRSGDTTLAQEIWPKLQHLISVFQNKLENNLIPVFEEKWHWNFYEWSDGLSGNLFQKDNRRFDAALNCLLSLALQYMQKIADTLGFQNNYAKAAMQMNQAVQKTFFCEERGVYRNSTEDNRASELVNALAILCGASQAGEAEELAHILSSSNNHMTPATLSMRCFVYDALLKVDEEKYRAYVLHDIAQRYERMLKAGATAFWETEVGESDFDNAGSLCHGWSAMPVHYYHRLLSK